MRRLVFLTLIAASALILAGCPGESGNNGNTNARMNTNSTTNNNAVTNMGTDNPTQNITVTNNTTSSANRWNANITEEEYEKDKGNYSNMKRATETVGSGAKDGWLWFKTRSALMTTDDLRETTIDVDVNNGVITLKGTVANATQKATAVKVANSIEGKTGAVKDMLKVSATDSATGLSTTDSDKTPANSNKK